MTRTKREYIEDHNDGLGEDRKCPYWQDCYQDALGMGLDPDEALTWADECVLMSMYPAAYFGA